MNAVEIRGLCKTYKEFALRGVDLELGEGFVGALIGRNGAGKTTLIKCLLELARRDGGEIRICGLPIPERGLEARALVGFVPEVPCLHEKLTPLAMGRIVSRFFRLWDQKRFEFLLERLAVPAGRKIRELSKGGRTKCQFALAMSHGAKLIVMDEPAASLDPVARREILSIMQEELERDGVSILISSHITSDLDKIADYFFVLDSGSIAISGTRIDLSERYRLVKGGLGEAELLVESAKAGLVRLMGMERGPHAFAALVEGREGAWRHLDARFLVENPSLEDLLILGSQGRKS